MSDRAVGVYVIFRFIFLLAWLRHNTVINISKKPYWLIFLLILIM